MARVALHRLSKTFVSAREIHALCDVCLEVDDQELLVVVGPSGSGKTTLLRLIAGLEHPTQGTIKIDGRVVQDLPAAQRGLAMVFQQSALYPHLTADQNLRLALQASRVPRREIDQRIQQTAAQLELTSLLDRLPAQLSGGEQQRVALGRALVRQPKVLLLDEPLSGLEMPLRQQLGSELLRLQLELGMTMIYVTHDQGEAMTLGHRIALLRLGSIEQAGPPLDLYQQPRNRFVAGFLGLPSMNFFKGTLGASDGGLLFHEDATPAARSLGGVILNLPEPFCTQLKPHAGCAVELGLRPEHLHARPPSSAEATNWTATVQRLQETGPECLVRLATQTHTFVVRSRHGSELKPHQRVRIEAELAHARFFDQTGLRLA